MRFTKLNLTLLSEFRMKNHARGENRDNRNGVSVKRRILTGCFFWWFQASFCLVYNTQQTDLVNIAMAQERWHCGYGLRSKHRKQFRRKAADKKKRAETKMLTGCLRTIKVAIFVILNSNVFQKILKIWDSVYICHFILQEMRSNLGESRPNNFYLTTMLIL